jgi:arginyl-tRNA synthetase
MTLASRIDAVLIEVFASFGLAVEFARSTPSDRGDLADRQCNGVMAASKKLDRNPREVADAIASALSLRPEFSEVSAAGPGFVNMKLSLAFLAEAAQAQAEDPDICLVKAASPERIVIDFGGPNVAKPLHVGHLRSLVIGESLRRILSSFGHHVLSDVHLGDWGLQMGQLISELEIRRPLLSYFDAAFAGSYPNAPPVTLADLEAMYPAAAEACKRDRGRLEAARKATTDLQSGRRGYRALWEVFRELSLAAQKRDFDELGAHFDLFGGESDAAPLIESLITKLRTAATISESSLPVNGPATV